MPGNVVAVSSGKGGVGKTSLTVNFAVALAGNGKKVLVCDADPVSYTHLRAHET